MEGKKLDASTGYTCISCRLVFANSALQREHYQTEWHRYNVKRQVSYSFTFEYILISDF